MGLAELVGSTPLTLSLKPSGGIHPIVVVSFRRQLVSKVANKMSSKDVSQYLNYF